MSLGSFAGMRSSFKPPPGLVTPLTVAPTMTRMYPQLLYCILPWHLGQDRASRNCCSSPPGLSPDDAHAGNVPLGQ